MHFEKPNILAEVMKTIHSFYTGTSEKMESLPDSSVDLIVTSPPYPMIEMWDRQFSEWDGEIGKLLEEPEESGGAYSAGGELWERMHRCLDRVWDECSRVLKPHAFICVNIGDAVRTLKGRFRLYPNHGRVIRHFESLGYDPLPLILWRKSTNAPNKFMGSGMLPSGAYVTLEHEYILIFRKGAKRTFSSPEERHRRRESAIFWEERNVWFSDLWTLGGAPQPLKLDAPAGSVRGTGKEEDGGGRTNQAEGAGNTPRERSGAFPWELAYRLINMYSLREDTVLDPFGGTGSTALAAAASCRNSVSYELEGSLHSAAVQRLLTGREIINSRIETRFASHLKFIRTHGEAGHEFRHRNREYGFPVKTSQEKDILLYEVESIGPTESRSLPDADRLQGTYRLCAAHRPARLPARQQFLDFC